MYAYLSKISILAAAIISDPKKIATKVARVIAGAKKNGLRVNGITNKPNIMCFTVKLYSETFMFQRCDILTHAVCPSQTVINKNIQMRHTETIDTSRI